MIVQDDYSRQINIFNPEKFNTPIHIIGAGATGSWLAFSLAKMGITNITIYDFDEVGMHNLPNQMFRINDIGCNKATSIRSVIRRFTGFNIRAIDTKVDGTQPMQGIVFILTDTMGSRKKIYDSLRNNPFVDLIIETRMDLRGGRIYAFDPKNKLHKQEYEMTLYSDDEAEVSACGISQTVLPTAMGIVSNAIWKMLNFINGELFENETIVDFSNEIIMNTVWGGRKIIPVITESMVIKVETEEESNELLQIFENQNIRWGSGEKATNQNFWDRVNPPNEVLCYHIYVNELTNYKYISYSVQKHNVTEYDGEKVISFKDFISGEVK